MKDDVLILNTLGRRHLPRLLPVIILAAAAVTVAVICNGSLEFGLFPYKYDNVTNYRGYLYAFGNVSMRFTYKKWSKPYENME